MAILKKGLELRMTRYQSKNSEFIICFRRPAREAMSAAGQRKEGPARKATSARSQRKEGGSARDMVGFEGLGKVTPEGDVYIVHTRMRQGWGTSQLTFI